MTWPTSRLMAGVLAVLALVLALEWLLPDAAPPAVSPARVRAAATAPVLAARQTGTWVAAVLARPVFSISRRPPKVVAGAREQVAGEARLAGIMITRAGRRAIFAPEGGGKTLVLGEGASVNQSIVRSILADRVVLASGAVLHPTYDRNRVPSAPFQPMQSAFQPGFANPNFPGNPGFPPQPGAAPPNFQLLSPPQTGEDGLPTPPPPVFRGAPIPQRRE